MKNNQGVNLNHLKVVLLASVIVSLAFLSGCESDDPQKEDTPEMVTKATLTFTPDTGSPVVVSATDPDGEGVQNISADSPINLQANKSYLLSISLINELADPSDPGYDVTGEVEEEGHEHIFLFEWTNNLFTDPAGNGNIDNRNDDVNYEDVDANSLPIGLETSWTAGGVSSGTFKVVLKHQPALKTATSGVSAGETDLDITFNINIQ
jgi:hypothetical protein